MTLVVALVIYTTRYVSLGSILLVAMMPVMFYIFKDGNIEFVMVGVLLMTIAVYRHRGNIHRLRQGNENELDLKKKK